MIKFAGREIHCEKMFIALGSQFDLERLELDYAFEATISDTEVTHPVSSISELVLFIPKFHEAAHSVSDPNSGFVIWSIHHFHN